MWVISVLLSEQGLWVEIKEEEVAEEEEVLDKVFVKYHFVL